MQEPLQNRMDIVVALGVSEVLQWFPTAWSNQSSSIYNHVLVDIVKMCIDDGTEEMQRQRSYFNSVIGVENMHYICQHVEDELRRLVGDLDNEALLKITPIPSEPDIPGVLWLHMPNPLYRG